MAETDDIGAIRVPSTAGGLVKDAVGSITRACVVNGGTAKGATTSTAGGSNNGVESTEEVSSEVRSDPGDDMAGNTTIRQRTTDKDQG